MVISLNKQSMRTMIQQDTNSVPKLQSNNKDTIRDSENTVKALKLVVAEQQREIDYLMQALEKVQRERDFAQGKALINEEISYAAEKSEKMLIAQLEGNVHELNLTIQRQASRIQTLEKTVEHKEEHTGVLIKYRDVIHPNTATILLHDEMETLHQLTIKLQLQITYMKSVQIKLVTMLHNLLSQIQNKIQEDMNDIEEIYDQSQTEFLKLLELIQNSKYLPCEQHSKPSHSPNHTENFYSPVMSPFPNKVISFKTNVNQTFDQYNTVEDKKQNVVPILNLNKALQIQQINAKRSTQSVKMTEDQLQNKIKKNEFELDECKKNLQREMLISKNYEIENEHMRRYIKQLEANNEILVKSNMNFQQKWEKMMRNFMFYRTFFVEHKDQFQQLQMMVQSEKEQKSHPLEDLESFNFNSARLHSKKQNTIRKRTFAQEASIIHQSPMMINDISSLMEVEKALNRQNQSHSQLHNNNRLQSESMINESVADYELGNACLERADSDSEENMGIDVDWKDKCKREWTFMATQVHHWRGKEMAQQIRSTIPIQKLTNIKK